MHEVVHIKVSKKLDDVDSAHCGTCCGGGWSSGTAWGCPIVGFHGAPCPSSCCGPLHWVCVVGGLTRGWRHIDLVVPTLKVLAGSLDVVHMQVEELEVH